MDTHQLLGDEADSLLNHECKALPAEHLVSPGPDFLSRVFRDTDRTPTTLRNLGTLYRHGRLGGTGYLSILPVDQGIEHSAAASFSKNPAYFDPANIVELALAGECNAVATTLGTLGMVSRRYVHRIPFIVKINHNQFCTTQTPTTRSSSGQSVRPSISVPQASAPPSTSALTTPTGSCKRSRKHLPRHTSSACSPCCGVTCATPPSRRTG